MCQPWLALDPKHSGQIGGQRRAAKLTPEERSESAKVAARARWAKLTSEERSEIGRKRVMARWKRRGIPIAVEIGSKGPFPRFESGSPQELSAIARRAHYLSRTYSSLPPEDRLEKGQLLTEFDLVLAEFLKLQTLLLALHRNRSPLPQ
jgi:hypothetical protein